MREFARGWEIQLGDTVSASVFPCGGGVIIDFCMSQRRLYYTLGIAFVGIVSFAAINGNHGEQAAKPQDSARLQEPLASTTLNRAVMPSSPIASSVSGVDAVALA